MKGTHTIGIAESEIGILNIDTGISAIVTVSMLNLPKVEGLQQRLQTKFQRSQTKSSTTNLSQPQTLLNHNFSLSHWYLDTMASPNLSISTPHTSLASEEQPPPTKQFTNLKELYQVISQVSGDFLIVQSK